MCICRIFFLMWLYSADSNFCARRLSVERYSYSDVAGWLGGWLGGWLSHAGTVSKRLNLSENFFDPLKAPSF